MPCPRAKSDMTPCYVKDGELAVAIATGWGGSRRICVGCEVATGLLREEREAETKKTPARGGR